MASSARSLFRLVAVVCAGTALSGAAPVPAALPQAGVTVELGKLPEKLVFPLPEGAKTILRAEVRGASPRSVWLAVAKDARVRIMLRAHLDGEYRLDLADPVVHGMLRHAGRRHRLRVFAETERGVAQSRAIPYELRGMFLGRLRFRLYLAKQEEPEGLSLFREHWYAPERVRRIELAYGASWPAPKAEAHVGELSFSFRNLERLRLLVLDMPPELVKAWHAGGRLEVIVQHGAWRARSLKIRARPRRLSFPGNKVTMKIVQRRSAVVPASNGFLRLSLGDITRGQVLAELKNAMGEVILSERSMRAGDRARFRVGDRAYVLVAEKLVNKLIGKDYGVFAITDPGLGDLDKIQLMLRHIAEASVTFVREGKDYDSKAAAAHLRRKFEWVGPKIRTLDEFIDKIASRSSTTGNPYRIRLPGGRTLPAGDWLRAQKKLLAERGWRTADSERRAPGN